MKSLLKILGRYTFAAVFFILLLFAVNMAGIVFLMFKHAGEPLGSYTIAEIVSCLRPAAGDGYEMSEDGMRMLEEKGVWAMLLNGNGKVVWDWRLPDGIPRRYTLAETASFTRWYLKDYPVTVWEYGEGIFVIGEEKGSVVKIKTNYQKNVLEDLLALIPNMFLGSILVTVLVFILMGIIVYRSLVPVVKGIEGISAGQAVNIPEKGVTKEVRRKLNRTSGILTMQREVIRKRDTARTNWIAGVSHDIRTPLSMIMGYAEQLEEDARLEGSVRKRAGIIKGQSIKIRELVNNLNLASRLEYEMFPLTIKKYAPAALLRAAAASCIDSGQADGFSIEIKWDQSLEKVTAQGDTALLARAADNVIGNSIRHNPQGCCIRLGGYASGKGFVITFSDTGTGLPEKVFLALEEGKDYPECHIMGLRIVKQIVEAHHGRFRAENVGGEGCRITWMLP